MSESQNSNKSIVWGLIGCGDVTEVKSAPVCFTSSCSHMVLCMRRDEAKARDYASRHSIPHSCSTIEEFYNSSVNCGVNSVYIATPPSSHKEYVIEALTKGYNVYIEKPIALNCSEACKIMDVLKMYPERKLSVAHYRRELPLFLHVKQLLDAKKIGTIRSCNLRCWKNTKEDDYDNKLNWRLNSAVSGGGYFHDLAPHQLDILLYYFGYPLHNQGMSSSRSLSPSNSAASPESEIQDHVYGMSLFPNNVVFNGSWCFSVPEEDAVDECIIIGDEGSIKFSFFGFAGTVHMVSQTNNLSKEQWHFEHPRNIQSPMINRVISYFNSPPENEPCGTSGENPCAIDDAVTVMKIMDVYTALSS